MSWIPTTPPPAKQAHEGLKMLVYGSPFAGKSHFASTWPEPFFISTDGNADRLTKPDGSPFNRVIITPVMLKQTDSGTPITMSGWEAFKELVLELSSDTKHQTIVIDLFSHIVEMCRVDVLEKHGLKDESDAGFGKGYRFFKTEFWPIINQLKNINKNILFITHDKNYDGKISPDLSGAVFAKVTGILDLVGMVQKQVNANNQIERVLVTQATDMTSGNRLNLDAVLTWTTYESLIQAINDANK